MGSTNMIRNIYSWVVLSIVITSVVLVRLAAIGQTPYPAVGAHTTSAFDASEIPPGANKFIVFFFGKPIGIEGLWKTGKSTWNYHFEFNERGHGPWIEETIGVDAHGIPVSLKLKGHDELEKTVSDSFRSAAGHSIWKNAIERGESDKPGFYLSAPVVHEQVSAVPEEVALLARALLVAPNQKLRVLPAGEVAIKRGSELNVDSHAGQKKIIRYEISGLDFQPISVWLEQDGTTFAIPLGEITVVRQGWEDSLRALDDVEERARKVREADMVSRLAHRPSSFLAYQHVNLFDAETATIQRDMTVVVSGERIQSVGPARRVGIPADAEVIDAHGMTLLPGLWDMHVHLEDMEGLMSLAVGVTTVRDLGNNVEDEVEMRQSFDDNTRIGPRMLLAGMVDGKGPYHALTGVLVDSEKEVKQAIDRYAALGFVQIKVYSSVKPELVPAIIEGAHSKGMRVSGHVPMHMLAQDVVKAGFDEIQHIYYIFLNFMPDVMNRDAPVGLVAALGERAPDVDPESEQVRAFIGLLKDHGTVVDPTLNAFESMLTARPGVPDPTLAAVLIQLPIKMRRSALKGGMPVTNAQDRRYREAFQSCLKMTGALYRAGIPLVVGTDFLAGYTYQRELELHVAAGIPPSAVLQAATLQSARIMKRDQDLGSISPGKLADMILVSDDPTVNISNIRHIVTVMKNGIIYSAPALQATIGVSTIKHAEQHGAASR
jgi:imidazolonepropionase-like amidohydrolase